MGGDQFLGCVCNPKFIILSIFLCQTFWGYIKLDCCWTVGGYEVGLLSVSTSLYYISLSLGFGNIYDRHIHPNINIRVIIWLGD